MFIIVLDSCMSCLVFDLSFVVFFFFKQKTAYEMRISDWSSDVCSSDLRKPLKKGRREGRRGTEPGDGLRLPDTGYCPMKRPMCLPLTPASWTSARLSSARGPRSAERRVGRECVSTCSSRW